MSKIKIVLSIILIIILVLGILLWRYYYNNMHYDENLMKKVTQAGFVEKNVKLPDDSLINYGEGPDNGPALLLIHGQTVAWEDYDAVLPELSKSFHVYAVDCYGHGDSSSRGDLYSCETNGKALIWFMDNVIKESCYLSGHSSGGVLVAWIAANAPEKVKGVVLEDPPLFSVTPEEIQEGKGAFAWYDGYVVTHNFVNQNEEKDFSLYYLKNSYLVSLFGGLQDKIYELATEYRGKNPGEPIKLGWFPHSWLRVMGYIDDYDPEFGNSFYDGSWMEGVDQEGVLKSIKCPVVYIKADTQYGKDGVLYAANSDEHANRVEGLIGNCERVNIKSGHNIHFEHPDVFISACEKLLEKE